MNNDYISRPVASEPPETVIKGIKYCASCTRCVGRDCPYYCDALNGCTDKLYRDVLALLELQEWHAIIEDDDGMVRGLPGDDGQYLMTDGKDIWIDDYVDGVSDGIFLGSDRDIREVTAWMYMPEPPDEGKKDG